MAQKRSLFALLYLLSSLLLFACSDIDRKDNNTEEVKKKIDDSLLLHVASPDWRDQIVYFVMLDRFQDGDPSNNDQGYNLYRPSEAHFYSGGDLQGLINRLDYIEDLGATTLWLTPPNANLWWSESSQSAGYHGYWARDFKAVDEHYGNLDTYKKLSSSLHKKNMFLIQDIVANHMGSFFEYKGEYDPLDTTKNFKIIKGNIPSEKPTQIPFNKNNRLEVNDFSASIYHWTPEITDYSVQLQEYTYQLSGLNDLNTSNLEVRTALKDSFGYWIKEVGVDAFRLDTAKFMEPEFLNDFLHSKDGILAVASQTGRNAFPVFGEIFETSHPFKDNAEQKIKRFMGTKDQPGLNGIIGFPLYKTIENVFRSGQATSEISYRIKKQMEFYTDPFMVLNFIDNHDVKRFQTAGNTSAVKQALAFIMTVPGIPVIYQGDEQELLETREAMFAGGYHADNDKFDQQSEMFNFTKRIIQVRKDHKVLSRGHFEMLAENNSGSGVLAYKRKTENDSAIILFNTSSKRVLLANMRTGLSNRKSLTVVFSENFSEQLSFVDASKISMELPARSIVILKIVDRVKEIETEIFSLQISIDDNFEGQTLTSDYMLSGTVSLANYPLLLIDNGDLESADTVISDKLGNWQLRKKNNDLGTMEHSVTLYDPITHSVSPIIKFSTQNDIADAQISEKDFIGDDKGLTKDYSKPTDPSYTNQLDISQIDILAGGRMLQLTLHMEELESDWLASNLFDHVAFTIFFDLPLTKGLSVLPQLNSQAPKDFYWDYGHQLFGWGNSMFGTVGADSEHFGSTDAKSPTLVVSVDKRTISVTYNANEFGIQSWLGSKIYVTTWDLNGEGEYRQLSKKPSRWNFSSPHENGPLILDDIGPILVSNSK